MGNKNDADLQTVFMQFVTYCNVELIIMCVDLCMFRYALISVSMSLHNVN